MTNIRLRSGWEKLALSDEMLRSLHRADYKEPTPVQAGMIAPAVAGLDVLAQAQTGTGKTAAFVIPIIETVDIDNVCPDPQALVLVPTRELVMQVHDEFTKLAHGLPIRCVPIYGGKPIRAQINRLRSGADVVVGTPGRILDHLGRRTLRTVDVDIVVLDEADRMLDIGFRPDIEKILRTCPSDRQTLLLSATVPPPIQRLAQRYMRDPIQLDFSPKHLAVNTIEQFYFSVLNERKMDLLIALLRREKPQQAIVFCRTKRGTEKVYQQLRKSIDEVSCIHGDLQQSARDSVMANLRAGRVKILVATDVVGRGIDVSGLSHIINFDIPQFCDDYVHRVGRTGRMGREGVAYTFVSPDQGNELTRIEMRIDRLLKRDDVPGITYQPTDPVELPDALEVSAGAGESPVGEDSEVVRKSSRTRRHRRAL